MTSSTMRFYLGNFLKVSGNLEPYFYSNTFANMALVTLTEYLSNSSLLSYLRHFCSSTKLLFIKSNATLKSPFILETLLAIKSEARSSTRSKNIFLSSFDFFIYSGKSLNFKLVFFSIISMIYSSL